MAGIGIEDGMAEKALESVRKMLDTMHGLVSLTPAYTRYQDDVREFSSSPPGHKENAGIFCHSNPWIIIAETLLGQGDFAFDHYRKTAPAYREEICDVHRMEPYVYSQMIVGKDARQHGEAKNSWLTVAASWNFIAVSQWILGVRPLYNGLQIDPCIPSDWNGYMVTRVFRGATYRITVKNPSRICKGIKTFIIDGITSTGNIAPVFQDGKVHEIEVIMG